MKLQGILYRFGVCPETCFSLSLATDGLGSSAKILMMALTGVDEEQISLFVAGGDAKATEKYTGIPVQVYDDLAIPPEAAAEMLEAKMHELGVTTLVCHSAGRFVKPRVLDAKLVPNHTSFLDIELLHKALRFWTEHLSEASNLIDMMARIERMRGKNQTKLDDLAAHYDVAETLDEMSPYVPLNKSRQVWRIFNKQLETELPF